MNELENIIQEMSNATGADNADVIATEKAIADMLKRRADAENTKQYYTTGLIDGHKAVDDRIKYYETCQKSGKSNASKKYICSGDYHDDGWYTSEGASLANARSTIKEYEQKVAEATAIIAKIDKDLPALQDKLVILRESATRASMTPEQRATYDSQQTIARGQADAAKLTAQAQADALDKSTAASSKTKIIWGIAGGITIITGVILYFIKRK